jgi:hypothetical protein
MWLKHVWLVCFSRFEIQTFELLLYYSGTHQQDV